MILVCFLRTNFLCSCFYENVTKTRHLSHKYFGSDHFRFYGNFEPIFSSPLIAKIVEVYHFYISTYPNPAELPDLSTKAISHAYCLMKKHSKYIYFFKI